MNRWLWKCALGIILTLSACGESAQVDSLLSGVSADPVLPARMTAQEEAQTVRDPSQGSLQAWPWQCDPATYGFEPASFRKTFPAEFTSTTGLLLGWPSWGCQVPEVTEIARHAIGRTQVTILVPPANRQGAEACLTHAGLSPADLAQIEWVEMPINSVWMRDYGPEIVKRADGSRAIIDMSYYPQLSNTCNNLVGRPDDDAAPFRLAEAWGLESFQAQVRHEGGNFLSDGQGRCFRSTRVPERVNCFDPTGGGWCYSPAELNALLGATYGCEVVALESLKGDVIDHIDMFMTFVAPKKVLVGRYDPAADPENAAILDRNAARLAALGYQVYRIPMPSPICVHTFSGCLSQENRVRTCDTPNTTRVFATYTNSIRVGDAMLVPVYDWVPPELRATYAAERAEALDVYRRALKNTGVTVIPIPSDTVIPCQGSFHCLTMTYE